MGLTEEFAKFVHGTGFEDMPEEAVSKSKEMFLDSIGVAIAGTVEEPSGNIAIKYAKEVRAAPEASVLGGGFRTWAPMAAFANALLAHNMDYDDWLPAGTEEENWPKNAGHASGIMVAVALALGEKLGLPGKRIIEAYVLGMESYTKIAINCGDPRERGWHSMGVYGCIGATAAAAKLLGLNVQQITMAFGIASSFAGGLRRSLRSMTNPLHAGCAARAGIEAALLAKEGFTSGEAILEAPTGMIGFCEAFVGKGGCDYERISQSLGKPFYVVSPGPGIKPYPCAWPTFYAAEAIMELRKEHGVAYEDVKEVEAWVVPSSYARIGDPEPKSGYAGRLSWEYVCAAALLDGKLVRDTFRNGRLKDVKFREALGKVKLVPDEKRAEEKGTFFAPIVMKLKDGREYRHQVDVCKGHPKNPLTHEEVVAKYRNNAGLVLSQQQIARSIELIEHLDAAKDVRELMDILATRAVS